MGGEGEGEGGETGGKGKLMEGYRGRCEEKVLGVGKLGGDWVML